MVKFPHANNRTIDDEFFLAMWKHIIYFFGDVGVDPVEVSIPRMNQAVDYDTLLENVPIVCLEVICRLLMQDGYLNTMMATNPFLEVNSHLLVSVRVINPRTGREVNGVKLTDLAKEKIKTIHDGWMKRAIALLEGDSEDSQVNTTIQHVEISENKEEQSSGNCSYDDFIHFLVDKLDAHSEPNYTWKYKIQCHTNWLPSHLRTGSSLAAAGQVLSIAGSEISKAIASGDRILCYECVEVIMDWGGVYYPVGPRKGNKGTVDKLHVSGLLLTSLIDDYSHLKMGAATKVSLMNAGWTKVWAALRPDDFVIFDSRVSFAFSKLLKEYCDLKCPQKDGKGYYSFANSLGYKQISQDRRAVPGFKAINGNPACWAQSMLLVSDILKSCLAFAKGVEIDICRYDLKKLCAA
jgi:hypothetical protein